MDDEKMASLEKQESIPSTSSNAIPIPTTDSPKEISATETEVVTASQKFQKWLNTICLGYAIASGGFLVALDETIVPNAVPKIVAKFHSVQDVGWYGSAYMLPICAFQLLFGHIYTHFSVKWTFFVSLFIFEIGSLVCATAPSSLAFIFGRAIAGVGSSGLQCGVFVIIAQNISPKNMSIANGMISAVAGVAYITAPLIGGGLAGNGLWRWCFYLNLPLAAPTFFIVAFLLKDKAPDAESTDDQPVATQTWKEKLAQFDWSGVVVLFPSTICLLLALQMGGSSYAWSNGRIIALLVIAGLLAILFVGIQYKQGEKATFSPRILSNKNVLLGAVFAMCVDASFYVIDYFLPLWFQYVHGVSPEATGPRLLPLFGTVVIGSIAAGFIVSKLRYVNPLMIICTILTSVGAGLITMVKPPGPGTTKTWFWIIAELLSGIGTGLGMQQGIGAAQTGLPPADVALGLSIVVFFQMLGPAVSISVGQTIFLNSLQKSSVGGGSLGNLSSTLPVEGTDSSFNRSPEVLSAYNTAIVHAFYYSLGLSCASAIGAALMKWQRIEDESDEKNDETSNGKVEDKVEDKPKDKDEEKSEVDSDFEKVQAKIEASSDAEQRTDS